MITVPASFSALARTETLEAAAAAGLDRARVRLLDEPVAALLDLLNSPDAADLLDAQSRNLLVFDYGAGTCDVALVRARFDPATRDRPARREPRHLQLPPARAATTSTPRIMDARGLAADLHRREQRQALARRAPARDRGHAHRHRRPAPEGADVPRRRRDGARDAPGRRWRRSPVRVLVPARAAVRRPRAGPPDARAASRWTPTQFARGDGALPVPARGKPTTPSARSCSPSRRPWPARA